MGKHDVVVIGASAGGVGVLQTIVAALPEDFAASVFIVLHVSGTSILPTILGRASKLLVAHPQDGEPIVPGRIYVAPPDRHLLIGERDVQISRGPRENGHRPSIDSLFRSAARRYRDRVIGVLLSGQLDDGSAGLFTIKARGGIAIVQDPNDAAFPSMPLNASKYVDVDHSLPAERIGPALVRLVKGQTMAAPKTKGRSTQQIRKKRKPSEKATSAPRISPRTDPEPLLCPDCYGPLFRSETGDLTQWGCKVGHTFSPDSLSEAQADALERVLWIAIRTLQERAEMQRKTVERAEGDLRVRLEERAEATERDAKLVRSILERL